MILQVDHVFQHPLSTAPRIRYSMLIRYPLESTRLTLPKTNRHSTWQEDVGAPRPKRKTHLPIPVFSGVYVYIYIYLCICFEGSEGFKNCSFPFPPTFHFQSWRPQKPSTNGNYQAKESPTHGECTKGQRKAATTFFATNDSIPPLRSMNKVSSGVFMVPRCFSDCITPHPETLVIVIKRPSRFDCHVSNLTNKRNFRFTDLFLKFSLSDLPT